MSLIDGLVSYWRMNGNSNDATGGSNGSDVNTSYSTSYGMIGQGVYISYASSSYIEVGSRIAAVFRGTNPWSISCWVNVPAWPVAGTAHIFGTNTSGANYTSYGLNYTINPDGSISAYHGDGAHTETVLNTNTGVVSLNTWYHLVATFDGGTTYTIYVNNTNQQIAAGRTWTSLNTLDNAYIGSAFYSLGQEKSNIYLDEFSIWNRALTSGEISSLYNGGSGLELPFSAMTSPVDTAWLIA